MDPRGFPTSLPEFQKVFPDDSACRKYLESLRWTDGFACPVCGETGEPYRFPSRSSVVLRCRSCKKNTSLTAGTVMKSHLIPHTDTSPLWGPDIKKSYKLFVDLRCTLIAKAFAEAAGAKLFE